MKIRYTFLAALTLLILLTASTTKIQHNNFVSNLVEMIPVLPEVPYDYDLDFPDHIMFGPWSFVDSTTINSMISPEGATLGRVLFYDKKLSKSNELSCASCHKQEFAFADNTTFSDGIDDAKTTRNSPNLNDIVWGGSLFIEPFGGENGLFWDSRETNLEVMVLQPIEHEGELGKDLEVLIQKLEASEYYAPLFEDAFGSPDVTIDRIGSAIAQFVRSMSSFNSKFDQVMMGDASFTAQEQMGEQLFVESCGNFCHGEPHFGSSFTMNNGLDSVYADQGMAEWTNSTSDVGKFRSPSLRNIEVTGPYMHDGRFETLEEVVDFYSDEVFPHPNNDFGWTIGNQDFTGFDFDDDEKAALVAFMKTLTDESFLTDEKWSDPFQEVSSSPFLPLEEKITIFPNPFKDKATVEFDNPSNATYSLRLTTVEGRVLKSYQTNTNSLLIEKGNLQAGVYMLEIRKDNRQKVEKVVIQ